MKVPPEAKEWMKKYGTWDSYWKRKEQYKTEFGYSPKQATQRALEEFYTPDDPPELEPKRKGTRPPLEDDEPAENKLAANKPAPDMGKPGDDQTYFPEIDKRSKKRRGASAIQIVKFVFENIDVAKITLADAPSAGALSLLRRLKRLGAPAYLEWVNKVWTKTLPSKTQVEALDRMTDDGRIVIATIKAIERVHAGRPVLQSRTEGLQEEPGVSA